jgi:hypothetical protein
MGGKDDKKKERRTSNSKYVHPSSKNKQTAIQSNSQNNIDFKKKYKKYKEKYLHQKSLVASNLLN